MATDIKVLQLRVRPLSFKLARPLETAGGAIPSWPVVLLDLQTNAGVVGVSFVSCFLPMLVKPLVSLVHDLGTLIQGDPLSPKDIDAKLRAMSRLIGTQGPLATAVTLIEIAAWDALAKTAELPLCRLLGSAPHPLPIYMTVPAMTPARVRELTQQALDRKYAGLKLKIGQADPAKDVALIEAARSVCGADFPLMADFNQSLSVAEATRRILQMDDLGLAWFEEPTDAKNVAGHSRIAQAARTPISLGENWHSPLEAAQNIRSGAADLAMPNIIAIGGISAWLKTAAIAEIHGVPVSGHSYPEISTNLLPLTTMAHWLEHADIFDDLFLNPVKPVNGTLAASELPGFGIAWDEAVVARSLLQGAV